MATAPVRVMTLNLSHNGLEGVIPASLHQLSVLESLDLSSNKIGGEIPQQLASLTFLAILNLSHNHLLGCIPKGKQFDTFENSSYQGNDGLHGLPLSKDCGGDDGVPQATTLVELDDEEEENLISWQEVFMGFGCGNNELNGTFPSWLGGLPDLKILSLRSNKLHGPTSDSRTDNLFAKIRVIDFSSNGFSGNLPVSLFENFQALKKIGENSGTREYIAGDYSGNYANILIVTTKGLDQELPRVLTTYMIIDLSRNRFVGHIASIIGDLVELRMLNLSHNGLEGIIPASLHQLSVLESLDLSSNKIGGEIPQQLASLTFLAVLNLSHNHLCRHV
ncbi:receptor-like protein Cf-9 homolog [Capsicum annuum]|uniref:receptor-like protein Cf-9 homolog n=1 Tax=Capsicum annuum TaxID=4072 RepID=UPI001FB1249D|nr:receptor-like protein Cf-9 homolog [Capsicum annuum]